MRLATNDKVAPYFVIRPSKIFACLHFESDKHVLFRKAAKDSYSWYRDSLEPIAPAIENVSTQREDSHMLRQAIRMLDETDRAIISMHLDGFDNNEIAVVLGISKNHVAVKLHRSKEQLSNLLKSKP